MSTSSQRAASLTVYALVLMLCSCCSRPLAASPAHRGGTDQCPLMMSSFVALAGLVKAWLPKCSVLFLLHAATAAALDLGD